MSKVCMAGVSDHDRTFTLGRLQERFPEIPEGVISRILAQHAHNMEKCLMILSQESDKYLYGESIDSPVSNNTNSVMEPLSIDIPSTDVGHSKRLGPLALLTQPNMTVAVPSSGGTTIVSGPPKERHQSVDEYNDYNKRFIQHQKQRLDRLQRECDTEKIKLSRMQAEVRSKEEELINKKFRVAGNPSKTHVDHLLEETQVLRTEIDQMTKEIDNINNGASLLGFVSASQSKTENTPSTLHRPHPIPPVRKSDSFPRPTGQYFTPGAWIYNNQPPIEGEHPNGSPVKDPSLENEGWVVWPREILPAPIPNIPTELPPPPPPPPPEDAEQTWHCTRCTLENHGALNVCEACEMLRN